MTHWRFDCDEGEIRDDQDVVLFSRDDDEPGLRSFSDMRLIVAAVNACHGIPIELLEQIVRERKCILYDVKNYGCCAGSTLVLDALMWAGNEDVLDRLEETDAESQT